ncbi:MAG TPA: ABC transporter permease [Erysipelothrix sp.]|nr:ABC transporter permease [Erysipelothrix sp.]
MSSFIEKHGSDLIVKLYQHISISATSLLIGSLIAIPLGILVSRNKKIAQLTIGITSILQTIPSLALLAIVVPFLGVGRKPAIFALVIYSLLPILRNTVLGMEGVDENTMDAAKGMGMNSFQQIFKVQLPLAMPVVFSGVRLSGTYVLAWATLAAYIGAGGMGDFIFAGLNNYNISLIVVGTLSITLLTLATDYLFGVIETKLTPTTTSEVA